MKFLLLATLAVAAFAAPQEDLITSLPLLNTPFTSTHYSGYLDAGNTREHFYWFTESQNDSVNDPLVLWLNGGPGCSSLLGAMTELGPYAFAEDGSELIENPYAWNTIANVFFMESPSCVGFSITNDTCATGDNAVADANYNALQSFFAKFPEYRSNDFYIFGESYAGIYIPTLSVRVVEGQETFPINFQGYGIGNGLLSYANNDDSLIFYANYHALVDPEVWDVAVAECCPGGIEDETSCDFSSNAISSACESVANVIFDTVYNSGLNFYNLIADCKSSSRVSTGKSQYDADIENLFMRFPRDAPTARSDPPCLSYVYETAYFNDETVRAALHVSPDAGVWGSCDTRVGLLYNREYEETRTQVGILAQTMRGLIYNGDTDMAVNVLGNEWDVTLLDLPVIEGTRTWIVDGQVAGFVKRFENLDFVTVLGSGHMVPEDKPVQALHMFQSFLEQTNY